MLLLLKLLVFVERKGAPPPEVDAAKEEAAPLEMRVEEVEGVFFFRCQHEKKSRCLCALDDAFFSSSTKACMGEPFFFLFQLKLETPKWLTWTTET